MNDIDFSEQFKKEKRKQAIRDIDVYKEEWDTGMFSDMDNEQLFKINFIVLQGLHKDIVKLKKELGWGIFIDDIGRLQIIMSLVDEMQKRFFDKEVIPKKR